MPPHPDRVRRNYPACFETGCRYLPIGNSDIAPFIGPTGLRVTWRQCITCGNRQSFTRTREEYLKELDKDA